MKGMRYSQSSHLVMYAEQWRDERYSFEAYSCILVPGDRKFINSSNSK
jgi:hypothetical protein